MMMPNPVVDELHRKLAQLEQDIIDHGYKKIPMCGIERLMWIAEQWCVDVEDRESTENMLEEMNSFRNDYIFKQSEHRNKWGGMYDEVYNELIDNYKRTQYQLLLYQNLQFELEDGDLVSFSTDSVFKLASSPILSLHTNTRSMMFKDVSARSRLKYPAQSILWFEYPEIFKY
jgi:UDP-galactopyranose mutase